MTIVSLLALSRESKKPLFTLNFCSTSRTNVAFVFSTLFSFFILTIIMIFSLWSRRISCYFPVNFLWITFGNLRRRFYHTLAGMSILICKFVKIFLKGCLLALPETEKYLKLPKNPVFEPKIAGNSHILRQSAKVK